MAHKGWQRYKSIDHALDVAGIDRYDLAARLTGITSDKWSYQMVAKLCTGRKRFDADIVWAVSKATGLPYGWFLDDPRDMLSEAMGAQLSSERDSRTYLASERYVYPDWHPINLFVQDEWHYRDTVDLRPLQEEQLPIAVGL